MGKGASPVPHTCTVQEGRKQEQQRRGRGGEQLSTG